MAAGQNLWRDSSWLPLLPQAHSARGKAAKLSCCGGTCDINVDACAAGGRGLKHQLESAGGDSEAGDWQATRLGS
jgi:hypothetical protein